MLNRAQTFKFETWQYIYVIKHNLMEVLSQKESQQTQ